jgi:hypothetical protein
MARTLSTQVRVRPFSSPRRSGLYEARRGGEDETLSACQHAGCLAERSYYLRTAPQAPFSVVGVSPEKEEAALKRGLFAACNVAFHKMLVAATCRFTSVNREDCFMNLRLQYPRARKRREAASL